MDKINFDLMSTEDVIEYINSVDYVTLDEQLNKCSFACLKRTYTKYFGFSLVSTLSRSYVQSSFRRYRQDQHRTDWLMGDTHG